MTKLIVAFNNLRTRLKTVRYNLHGSRRHKSATTALLCNTRYLYIVDSDVELSDTHTMNFCVLTANCLCEHATMLRYRTFLSFLLYNVTLLAVFTDIYVTFCVWFIGVLCYQGCYNIT